MVHGVLRAQEGDRFQKWRGMGSEIRARGHRIQESVWEVWDVGVRGGRMRVLRGLGCNALIQTGNSTVPAELVLLAHVLYLPWLVLLKPGTILKFPG